MKILESISLWGTFHTVALAVLVVKLWGAQALQILKYGPQNSNEWFIIGVFFGFVGQILDNSYWFIPWSMVYCESDAAQGWIMVGVGFNIVFRQLMGSIAAYCHVKSYMTHGGRPYNIRRFLIHTSIVATFYLIILSYL